jgi:hypothetical protein
VKEYIEGAKPIFSVGEYWDSCNYNGHFLEYNQGITSKYILHPYSLAYSQPCHLKIGVLSFHNILGSGLARGMSNL